MKIVLGFDDGYWSMYDVPVSAAEGLQGMDDIYEMAEHVIEHGKYQIGVDLDTPATFMDTTLDTVDNVTEFLDTLATDLVDATTL